jgi:hypothetical protein
MALKYFLYSMMQFKFRRDLEARLGKTFKPGQVFVNGKRKLFTEISYTPTSARYSDAKVVAQGDPKNFKYSLPGSK